jgi:hypothetical protein
VAIKIGHQGAVLAILNPVLNKVDANGFVREGWGFNNIHNGVKIMLYEGHDNYDEFATQLQAIKQELRVLCDGPGMELDGTIYTFKLVMGGDMAFQGGAFGHVGAASTFFCFICDMARKNKHLTLADYQRKGMTPPMEKTTIFAAMIMAHAFGEEYGFT